MKINPITSGVDKVIINGTCKESPIKYEENRIVSREVRTTSKDGVNKPSVSFNYGEHEKINTFEVPFFGIIHQYQTDGIIKNSFYEKMKYGKMYFNSKLVLFNDFGQLYKPSTKQTTGLMPFRYVFNPNKALRSGSSFINFFNDLIETAESFEIPELHINFDFEESISNYVMICLNTSRVHNDNYQNIKYFGFQQKAAVRHVIYDKKVEMLAKKKSRSSS